MNLKLLCDDLLKLIGSSESRIHCRAVLLKYANDIPYKKPVAKDPLQELPPTREEDIRGMNMEWVKAENLHDELLCRAALMFMYYVVTQKNMWLNSCIQAMLDSLSAVAIMEEISKAKASAKAFDLLRDAAHREKNEIIIAERKLQYNLTKEEYPVAAKALAKSQKKAQEWITERLMVWHYLKKNEPQEHINELLNNEPAKTA
jgi:hypothetical protein